MKPIEAQTIEDICQLERDNYPDNNKAWSILMGVKHISLHSPSGESGWLEIPRDQFDAIVRWYVGEQS